LVIVEHRIEQARPWSVALAVWVLVPIGFLAPAYLAFAFAGGFFGEIAFSIPVALMSALVTALVVSIVLIMGLRRARLFGWFAALTWAGLWAAVAAVEIGNLVDGGLGFHSIVAGYPFPLVLITASGSLVGLLCWPSTWRWHARAHRLRRLSQEELEKYVASLQEDRAQTGMALCSKAGIAPKGGG
jgi:hypothetical protein